MVDRISEAHRSWNMSRIKSKNTKPELLVRSMLHRMNYRFTVNGPLNKNLPGRPDIALPKYKTVVFVHGCFWHRCKKCNGATIPKTRTDFWLDKFEKNVRRDKANQRALKKQGWKVRVLWECELKEPEKLKQRLLAQD